MSKVLYLESIGMLRSFHCISTDKAAVENFIVNQTELISERIYCEILGKDVRIQKFFYGHQKFFHGHIEMYMSEELTRMFILQFLREFNEEILLECPSREELEKLGLF